MRPILVPTLIVSALVLASCSTASTTPVKQVPQNAPVTNINATQPVTSSGSTATPGLKTFTLAEVMQHNTETDCYAVIGNDVYDLSKWINRHPGGPEAIMSTCGLDISEEGHPGGTPLTEMAKRIPEYKIGTIAR